jgi:predicted transcriptional regulator
MSKARFARIAITLPRATLVAADQLASEQDRSRSWVIAEAVRQYARESVAGAGVMSVAGLGDARRAQLKADLRLNPEERVREAEETTRVAELVRPRRGSFIVAFERFEDYLDWKRQQDAGATWGG